MARNWNEVFATWAKPPSDTEDDKAARAARMITEAVRSSEGLRGRNFDVYASGSYRNNTNVRLDSDVDVAVVLRDAFYCQYPANGLPSRELLGYGDAAYGYASFRDDVGSALTRFFGAGGVTAGDKAFDIHANTVRLDADVCVFLEHRRFTGAQSASGGWVYEVGVETRPRVDPSKRIINWHQQHYAEGVAKNDVTKRRFKRLTRILKRLRNEMKEQGNSEQAAAADVIPSFLIECLVFNVPDSSFNLQSETYYSDLRAVIVHLWGTTKDAPGTGALVEVSKMKFLFNDGQAWRPEQVRSFLQAAWNYVGFA